MAPRLRFWLNVVLVGLLHVAVVIGIARWSGHLKKPTRPEVVWMAAPAGAAVPAFMPMPEVSPPNEPEEDDDEKPAPSPPLTSPPPAAENAIPLATPTPLPTPTAKPTPKPTPRPTPKSTPRKKTGKAKPKSTPRKTPAKKSTPKPKSTPKKEATAKPAKSATVVVSPTKSSGSGGSAKDGRGSGSAAEFNWYGNMLHDRFHSAWNQPKSANATGSRMSARVQVRIEADGRVSQFRIVQSSGNVVVDESVEAIGQRVTRVDPLPAPLAQDGHYDVTIKFELDVE